MADAPPRLIAGLYGVDAARPLAGAGGGVPAFAVVAGPDAPAAATEGRHRLMALAVQPGLAPRAHALAAFPEPIDGLLTPLAHGRYAPAGGQAGYYVVCGAPPGPALSAAMRPWPEAALMQFVLRPIARVLEQLAARRLTHRAIRPDNVFQAAPGQAVVLGAAWATPPASLQPAVVEPPYAAMCAPSGRGDGNIADDVYALGVLLVALALGRLPLSGLDADATIRLKLEVGSYGAVAGQERLPPLIADLARTMLAEDPEHRPSPAMLLDPHTARSRRVAARAPRRATRALAVGGREVWDSRSVAFAMATQPDAAAQILRDGTADLWLRRALTDAALAGRVDEAVRQRAARAAESEPRADALMVMRVITALDPLAPLCWNGLALWPDAVGALLVAAEAEPALLPSVEAVIDTEAPAAWVSARQDDAAASIRVEARRHRGVLRQRGPGGGPTRLRYALNPLHPCASKVLAGLYVVQPGDIPAALEQAAGRTAGRPARPIDAALAGFLVARMDGQADPDLAGTQDAGAEGLLRQLRVTARLQARFHPAPLPALADWIASGAEIVLATWRGRQRRAAIRERLAALVKAGQLTPILALLDDPAARSADAAAAQLAEAASGGLKGALAAIEAGAPARAEMAARLGQEIAAALGLAALVTMLVLAVMD